MIVGDANLPGELRNPRVERIASAGFADVVKRQPLARPTVERQSAPYGTSIGLSDLHRSGVGGTIGLKASSA